MAELDYQSLDQFVKRAIEGDSNAFAEIYAGTFPQQYRFAYYFLKDVYKAQDAIVQTYTYVLQNLRTLKDTAQLMEWMEQINYHMCYHLLYPTATLPAAKFILNLPYLESAAFIMYAYQKMSIHDIAVATGQSKKKIQKIVSRTCKKVMRNGIPVNVHLTTVHIEPSELDAKSADFLLTSVLYNLGYETQSISVNMFREGHLFKTENYALQKTILGLIVCALLVMPLLFLVPSMKVSQEINLNNGHVAYQIQVQSMLRVKSVSAQLDGNEIMVYETANKVYTIEPEEAGTAVVTVTLENGQYETKMFEVE